MNALPLDPVHVIVTLSHIELQRLFKELDPVKVNPVLKDFDLFPNTGDQVGVELAPQPVSEPLLHGERVANFIETLSFLELNPYFILKYGKLVCQDQYVQQWGLKFSVEKHVVFIGMEGENDPRPVFDLMRRNDNPQPYHIVVKDTFRV
jgi:hypothetical protein